MYRPLLLLTKGKLANKSQRIQGKEKIWESQGGGDEKQKKRRIKPISLGHLSSNVEGAIWGVCTGNALLARWFIIMSKRLHPGGFSFNGLAHTQVSCFRRFWFPLPPGLILDLALKVSSSRNSMLILFFTLKQDFYSAWISGYLKIFYKHRTIQDNLGTFWPIHKHCRLKNKTLNQK